MRVLILSIVLKA